TAEADAQGIAVLPVPSVTGVSRIFLFRARVVDDRASPATLAANETGKQRGAILRGADARGPHGVLRDHLLDALEVSPADVALMMVFDQDAAFCDRFAHSASTELPIVETRCLLVPAIRVDAGIDRVL